ncbi:hypothetical protein [Bradyrhizobium cosmicum]|uniref:Uncharacterized protein n=1 Tax=Bradyrhizobium cosmicum TaxID=1404864 RepID=A0AAI8M859_9BRAD|nr:hypothetical protein [Bradyrhizobium cosmicum]BAL73745.1 hypothetical protein S23_05240 [Bradyrhizobium cosmicum]
MPTTATDESKFPSLLNKRRKEYLCRVFGSENGAVAGIQSEWDRMRLLARFRFEEAYARLWISDALRFCETAEDREEAIMAAHHSVAETEAWHRKALKRPALLHNGLMAKFIQPFGENARMPMDNYCTVGSAHESPVTAMCAQVSISRVRHLCYRAWSPDKTPGNVPEDWKPWFRDELEYQQQAYDAALETICRHYGSATGLPADIPAANHAAAACYWRRWQARQEMKARFEHDLYVIDHEEQQAHEAEEAAERKAEEVIDGIERHIEDVARGILYDVLAEQGESR